MMPSYRKKQLQELTPYVDGLDLTGVSISDADKANGSPKLGDMIATNPQNSSDRWLVAEKFFLDNYEPVDTVNAERGGAVAQVKKFDNLFAFDWLSAKAHRSLPDGVYKLYTAPQPPVAPDQQTMDKALHNDLNDYLAQITKDMRAVACSPKPRLALEQRYKRISDLQTRILAPDQSVLPDGYFYTSLSGVEGFFFGAIHEHTQEQIEAGDITNVRPFYFAQPSYEGAREDLLIWKKRALEAEEKVRVYDKRIVGLGVLSMETATDQSAYIKRLEAANKKYEELLLSVANKYPNETRHETALRYIKQREQSSHCGGDASKGAT